MAILTKGVLGSFKGNISTIQGQSLHSKCIIKSRTLSVVDKKSESQLIQRQSFKKLVSMSAALKNSYIDLIISKINKDITDYNYFCKINRNCFNSVGIFDSSNFFTGGGKLMPIKYVRLVAYNSSLKRYSVYFNLFDNDTNASNEYTCFILYSPDHDNIFVSAQNQLKSSLVSYLYPARPLKDFSSFNSKYVYCSSYDYRNKNISKLSGRFYPH